jgi:hypothetical protein
MQRVLLITTASDLAADLVILQLRRRGVSFVRFNQERFPAQISMTWPGPDSDATLTIGGEVLRSADVSSAWFRHPIAPTPSDSVDDGTREFVTRECAGFLAGYWETAPWFWMNRPSAAVHAASKLRQLAEAKRHGLAVPETLITNCPTTARAFLLGRDGIAKVVTSGGLNDAGRRYAIHTTPISGADLSDEAVRAAPVIFQERITNHYDLRVTIVGTLAFATRIIADDRGGNADWRAIEPSRLKYERHDLPPAIEARCIALVKAFSLSFAALDFVVTPDGEHVFLELNPSGQWGWLEEATGVPITDAIVDQLIEGKPCALT